MDFFDVADGSSDLTVNVNGLVIPASLIDDHLAEFCTSLGVLSGSEEFPIYIPGSATLIRYRDRYFMICTRHHLAGTPDYADVCLLIPAADGQTKCFTSAGVRWFATANDGDHHQIVAFDFSDPCRANPELLTLFFNFRGQRPDMPVSSIACFVSYGYPTSHTDLDLDQRKINQQRAHVVSRFAPPGPDQALHNIEPAPPLGFDPDGMSGGPAFCLTSDGQKQFSVHFAGVIVRGSRERLMLIKAGAVQAMLDAFFTTEAPAALVRDV